MTSANRPPLYPELAYLGSASAYVEEVIEVLCTGTLFGEFSRQEIEMLSHFMDCYAAPRGTTLIGEGEEGEHMLIILTGRVSVEKLTVAVQQVTMAVVGPGSCLGEMSMIDGVRRFASCTTLDPVDFAVLTRANLNEMLIMYPRLANKLLIKLLQIEVGRLRETGVLCIDNNTPII